MDGLAKSANMKKGKAAIAEIVAILMMSRTVAHMMHLKTGSYAEHEALGGFYSGISGLVDSFAETAQGKYGKLDIQFKSMEGNLSKPAATLENHIMQIKRLDDGCDSRMLQALIDDIETCYTTTLYKLRELA